MWSQVGVLPLIWELRTAHPRVTQPWYADDAGAGETFQQVQEHFQDLQARGPARGYYPEPTKSILVVAPGNVARDEEHFRGLGPTRRSSDLDGMNLESEDDIEAAVKKLRRNRSGGP